MVYHCHRPPIKVSNRHHPWSANGPLDSDKPCRLQRFPGAGKEGGGKVDHEGSLILARGIIKWHNHGDPVTGAGPSFPERERVGREQDGRLPLPDAAATTKRFRADDRPVRRTGGQLITND